MNGGLKYSEDIVPLKASTPAIITKLIALHSENQETVRLVNLHRRSFYVPIVFLSCTGSALALFHYFGASTIGWIVLMAVAIGAEVRSSTLAYHGALTSQALKAFEADFEKVQLMSGFAWGAGAFLVTTALTPAAAINLFAFLPCLIMAVLLRTRRCVLLFIAPVAILSMFACIARSQSLVGTIFILLGCAAAAVVAGIADRGPIKFPLATLALTSRVFSTVTQR